MDDYDCWWNTSYVYAVDNASGWGGRFFFTYFSEFDNGQTKRIAIEVTLFIAIFLLSVVANVCIILCVLRFPEMRTVTNYFILNLAIADLTFAFTIPAVAYIRVVSSWNLGEYACKFIPYVQFVSGIVLLYTLAAISVDRHRCIVVPPYRSKMSLKKSKIISAVIWLTASVCFIPVLLWFHVIIISENVLVCTLIFPNFSSISVSLCFIIVVVFLACGIPIIVLCYYYQSICKKIISTRDTWASSCVVVSVMDIKGCNRQGRRQSELSVSDIFVPWPRRCSNQMISFPHGRQNSLSQQETLRKNKHIRVVRVVLLNIIVVCVMWIPITVIMVLIYSDGHRSLGDTQFFLRSHHFISCLIIAFLNSLINPILYGVFSDNFRANFWRLLRCRTTEDNVRDPLTLSSCRHQNNNNGARTGRKKSSVSSVSET